MDEKKEHQIPLTIDEQIQNLKDLKLVINDEEYAKEILNDISYFRLIKAYSLGLKNRNSDYDGRVSFDDIVELYLFNSNFRQLLFPYIEIIEINTRCRIGNYVANKYGVLAYRDSSCYTDEEYHAQFLSDIDDEIRRNSKAPFVRNFQNNYEGGDLPIYALFEILSFGTLSKFYKNLHNSDKRDIAKQFGVGYTYFESWLECFSYVRNVCAHYGRLYNARLVKTPKLYSQYSKCGIKNNRIFGVILCMKHVLKNDKHWTTFTSDLEKLINKYNGIDIKTMGFPDNWKELLSSND